MDIKVITARFYEDPEWKHVEDILLSKLETLQEFGGREIKEWQGNIETQVVARMLCYNILKDFLMETKLVNREIPVYKNKFK